MSHRAVLEIGTEEIPAKQVATIHKALAKTAAGVLEDYRIDTGEIRVTGAPRRLTLIFEDISRAQSSLVEEIKGPPCNIAFDEQGEPTKAAEGFARSQGVEVEALETRETDRGQYLYAVIERENRATTELLPEVFPEIIERVELPIAMRWSDREFEFIRPIHWLMALFDREVIDFKIAGINSGRISQGHRFLGQSELEIDSADSYFAQLRENYVIADQQERRQMIMTGIKGIEQEIEASVDIDEQLLKEVVHLVEYPTPFLGNFNSKYLELPEPVLVTPLKEHQRYFPVRDEQGELMACFVGVRDGSEKHLELVREGNEKVLKARLEDADFYYEKDLDTSMEDRVKQLQGLVFREELGSMYDKVGRMQQLVGWLAEEAGLGPRQKQECERSAYLSKADLVSQMVREFPELQGIIGKKYAELEGEAPGVTRAIAEHYQPRTAGDSLPETIQGQLLGIADRIDTLLGTFGIGLIPTGSEDPYGLRRSAMGVVRILSEAELDLRLTTLCEQSLRCYRQRDFQLPREGEVVDQVVDFLLERVDFLLEDRGLDYDLSEALIKGIEDSVPRMMAAGELYLEVSDTEEFQELVMAYNRVDNIVGDRGKNTINPELFLEKSEQNLYNIYLEVDNNLEQKIREKDYPGIFSSLTELIEPIHEFFESVRVMAEDDQVRDNRLNLLEQLRSSMAVLGDLSLIVIE